MTFIQKIAIHAKSSGHTGTDDVAALCDAYTGFSCGTGLHRMSDDAFAALLDEVMAEVQHAPFDRDMAAVCRQADRDFRACEQAEHRAFALDA